MKNAVLIFVTLFLSHGAFSANFSESLDDEVAEALKEGMKSYQDYFEEKMDVNSFPPELQNAILEIAFKQSVIESIDQALYVNEALGLNNVSSNQRKVLSIPLAYFSVHAVNWMRKLGHKGVKLVTPNKALDHHTLTATSKDLEFKIMDIEDQIKDLENQKRVIRGEEPISTQKKAQSTKTPSATSSKKGTAIQTGVQGTQPVPSLGKGGKVDPEFKMSAKEASTRKSQKNTSTSNTSASNGMTDEVQPEKAKTSNGGAEVADEVQPEKAKTSNGGAEVADEVQPEKAKTSNQIFDEELKKVEEARQEKMEGKKQRTKQKLTFSDRQHIKSIESQIKKAEKQKKVLLKKLEKYNKLKNRGFFKGTFHKLGRLSRGLGYTVIALAGVGAYMYIAADTIAIISEFDEDLISIREIYQEDVENLERLIDIYYSHQGGGS